MSIGGGSSTDCTKGARVVAAHDGRNINEFQGTNVSSNRSRELSEATKRRCLHLQLDYPDAEMELEIVRLKAPGIGDELARDLVAAVQRIRALDLRKAPSIGETLDWAQALVALGGPSLSHELIEETLSVVVKYDGDASKVPRALADEAGKGAPAGD